MVRLLPRPSTNADIPAGEPSAQVRGRRIGGDREWRLISYWPVSNVHSAPTPSFFLISFGSIMHSNFEMFSTIDPAAPSDEAPALSAVALNSFASRPVKVRLRTPEVRSQVRAVMSTLLVLQTTESAVTEMANPLR